MNVEEKVATLEALLARVKKNAALPRAPRTDEMAATAWAPMGAVPQPIVKVELTAPKPLARPVKIEPVKVEPSDPWLDELADIVAGVNEQVAPPPKPAEVAPAALKTARPIAPQLSARESGSAPPKVAADKIAPTATGSALPKVTPAAKPAADKIAPTASGSALPKVTSGGVETKPTKTASPVAGTAAAEREARLFAQLALMPDEPTGDDATKIVLPSLKSELVAATKAEVLPKKEVPPKVEAAPKLETTPTAPPALPLRKAPEEDEGSSEEETRLMEGTRPSAADLQVVLESEEKKAAAAAEPEKMVITAAVVEVGSPAQPTDDVASAHDPAPTARAAPEPEPAPAELDEQPALPPSQVESLPPEQEADATSPSHRYRPPPEPEISVATRPPRSRVGLVLVAVLLAAAGAYLAFMKGWFGDASETPPVPTATPSTSSTGTVLAPPVRTVVPPAVTATARVSAPTTSATTASSAATAPTTSAAAPAVPAASAVPAVDGDGTKLPPNRGYLVVDSPKEEGVYNGGVFIGLTGHTIELECGIKFVRLGVPPADGVGRPNSVVWTSEGKSAIVACKSITKVAITPTR